MSEAPPLFSPRLLRITIAVSTLSLLAGFAAAIFGEAPQQVRSAQANSWSYSAIGHRALYELLRDAGFTLVRQRSTKSDSANAIRVVLEPPSGRAQRIRKLVHSAKQLVVAMPKRTAYVDTQKMSWAQDTEIIDLEDAQRIAHAARDKLELYRTELDDAAFRASWQSSDGRQDVELKLPDAQLFRIPDDEDATKVITAVVGNADGALIVRTDAARRTRWLISDPDLFANHGLAHPENARLTLEFFREIVPDGVPIFLDETVHGFTLERSILAELRRFPLVLLLVQFLLVVGCWIWAGLRRFGAPSPAEETLGRGKRLLIDNTADLLCFGGHSGSTLQRFLALEEKRVARAWHINTEKPDERRARLAAIESKRPVDEHLATLASRIHVLHRSKGTTESQILAAARDIVRWRIGMLHGRST